jgi:hypothetical protein
MPSRKPAKTARRLLKLVSLGFAGLIAGLLSGCAASPNTSTVASYSPTSGWRLNSSGFGYSFQPKNLNLRPVPDLRHPPAPHHIQSWAFRTPHQQTVASQINPGQTLTNYDFTGGYSNSGSAHLAIQ